MIPLPDSVRTVLRDRAYAHVVTRNRDGSPQVTMVWVDVDGDYIVFNTDERRLKARNLRRDPRIVLSIQNPQEPQQYILAYGTVAEITGEGAEAHMDALSPQYLEVSPYPYHRSDDERVLVKVAVDRLLGRGPWVPGRQR